MVSDFKQRCIKVVERFLQNIVIVDDEPYFETPQKPKSPERPSRTQPRTTEEAANARTSGNRSLDAQTLVNSFAERGLICAIVAPRSSRTAVHTVATAAKRADMVVLDWQMRGDNGKNAQEILNKILDVDAGKQLRLIAIYTADPDICGIARKIANDLNNQGMPFQTDDLGVELSYLHCRIVIYAKNGTYLKPELKDRSIAEADIAQSLIGDFASMTEGLLPSIALTSLAAIRENAHKVLDKFHAELDPAFLAHRACLPIPEDSQQQMVDQLASELHAIMDDAASRDYPAGIEAVKKWLEAEAGQNKEFVFEKNKTVSLDEAVDLQTEGWKKKKPSKLNNREFGKLASVFAKNGDPENKLDLELAWMFSFRTVFDDPRPILHLGTVLRQQNKTSDTKFFLCMRPKCDSVRLKGEESFLLLPLIKPEKKIIQLVLRTCKNTFQRFSVGTKASQWQLVKFNPENDGAPVIAEQEDDTGLFFFTDVDGKRFDWLGELKPEFAQRIAHRFASGLSRIAVNNSEWLRRLEKLSD